MEIEKGVPIPPMKPSRYSKFSKMNVGESVLCESESQANGLRRWMHGKGWRGATRKAPGGWRVWRVEDKKPGLRVVA